MVRLPDETFHSYRCEPPSLEVEVTKDQLVDMYQNMVSGLVGLFFTCGIYLGQCFPRSKRA